MALTRATSKQVTHKLPTGTVRNVYDKLGEFVSVKDFGAVCDGVADDTAAVQAAVNYCASFGTYWPALIIPGRCKLTSSVNINRLVDNTKTEFRIIGQGSGAGFYGTGTVTFFDSTLTMAAGRGTPPVSEFVTFENINFEASSFFDECFVLSRKFLRIKFINCFFWLIRCQASDTYAQTLYFVACNIRNNKTNFINTAGLYDVTFDSCIIENGSTIIRSIDPDYGTSGLRFINNVIEGIGIASVVVAAGVSGFDLIGNHLESNFSPEFNFFGAGPVNGSVTVIGNYIYNPSGATFYYGATEKVFSSGNKAFPSVLHSNAALITDLISCADSCPGGISDATNTSVVNGVYRAGGAQDAWTHSAKHFTKSTAGEFGFGWTPLAGTRAVFWGQNQLSTGIAVAALDSAGNSIFTATNDRQLTAPAIGTNTGTALVLDASGYIKKQSSSLRYKKDVAPIDIGLNFIKGLTPVKYRLKDGDVDQVGFIAEDFPDERLVGKSPVDPDDLTKGLQVESVNYAQLVAPLTRAVQELSQQVEALEAKVSSLGG